MGEFLLIDTSTQVVQCGTVSPNGEITATARSGGDVVEVFPNLVGKFCESGFGDKLGIIYCHGPGSTLGLRSALVAINVWIRFCGKNLKLYRYTSLSMAKYLAKNGVVACGNSGKFVGETLDGEIKIIDAVDGFENFHFLNTKRVAPVAVRGMQFVDYDLGKFSGSIFDISREIKVPDLFEIGERQFLKWSGGRHCKSSV
jgi:hypothetical protein